MLFFKMVRPQKILKVFSIFKKEGIDGVKYHFYLIRDRLKGLNRNCMKEYDISPVAERKSGKMMQGEYPLLLFREYTQPVVSILIPVYNQFEYTYQCLKHMKKYEANIP